MGKIEFSLFAWGDTYRRLKAFIVFSECPDLDTEICERILQSSYHTKFGSHRVTFLFSVSISSP